MAARMHLSSLHLPAVSQAASDCRHRQSITASPQRVRRFLIGVSAAERLRTRPRRGEYRTPPATICSRALRASCCCTSVHICSSHATLSSIKLPLQVQREKREHKPPCSSPGAKTWARLSRETRGKGEISTSEFSCTSKGAAWPCPGSSPKQLAFLLLVDSSSVESIFASAALRQQELLSLLEGPSRQTPNDQLMSLCTSKQLSQLARAETAAFYKAKLIVGCCSCCLRHHCPGTRARPLGLAVFSLTLSVFPDPKHWLIGHAAWQGPSYH